MLVKVDSLLKAMGPQYALVDLQGIQEIIDTFSDPTIAAAAHADPQDYMVKAMNAKGIRVPDGLHFHWRNGSVLVPPEAPDCVPTGVNFVLKATPSQPYEVESIPSGKVLPDPNVARPRDGCHSCFFICIIF